MQRSNDIGFVRWLVDQVRAGQRGAIARALTEVERDSDVARAVLAELQRDLRGLALVGVTGPPGVGKSTLVNALVADWRRGGQTVAVIAVDPSSALTRGAILGDRIRMTAARQDDGVFVRSLASQGNLGGLSPSAVRLTDVFDAAGFDRIIIETVGTGQSEMDVAEIADVTVVVCAPGLGDDIQAMKSGLLEIADILVVNKADLPAAEETAQQLAGAVSLRTTASRGVAVLKTSATRGDAGIGALAGAIDAHVGTDDRPDDGLRRRRRRMRYLICQAAAELLRMRRRAETHAQALDAIAGSALAGDISLAEAGQLVLQLVGGAGAQK